MSHDSPKLLAHESERAAVRDIEDALALGALTVRVAELTSDPLPLKAAAKEYAWIYWGNARRVKGWLNKAEAAFAQAKREAPAPGTLAMSRAIAEAAFAEVAARLAGRSLVN